MNTLSYDTIGLICVDLPIYDLIALCLASRHFWKALNSKKLAYCWHYKYQHLKIKNQGNRRANYESEQIKEILIYGKINIIQPEPLYTMDCRFGWADE